MFHDLIGFFQKILFSSNNVNKLNLNKRQPNLFTLLLLCFTFDSLLCPKFVLFSINLAEFFWKSVNWIGSFYCFLFTFSINLQQFCQQCCSLIGYATHYYSERITILEREKLLSSNCRPLLCFCEDLSGSLRKSLGDVFFR